jgi:signal peptidase I
MEAESLSSTPPAPPPPALAAGPKTPDSSIRETLESIIIAFVLAVVFRAFVVEAFVIPTGSMAPTLLGQHVQVVCPHCGYRFTAGPWDNGTGPDRRPIPLAVQKVNRTRIDCPMCQLNIPRYSYPLAAGDRILVLKYIYAFSEPRRWDVVVFKNPEHPEENYIKRLIGLPNEQVWIVGGNIYTRPLGPNAQPNAKALWQVQRKPEKAQRAVWQPVYHSDFVPLNAEADGWKSPWRAEGQPEVDPHGSSWKFTGKGAEGLSFDFEHYGDLAYNFFAYNETEPGPPPHDPVEEWRLAATLIPQAGAPRVTMTVSGPFMMLRGTVEPDGTVRLETRPIDGDETQWKTRGEAGHVDPLTTGRATRVELWSVDQSLSVWVDGKRTTEWAYTLEDLGVKIDDLAERPIQLNKPTAKIDLQGGPTVLRAVDLDRDLYHTQMGARAVRDEPAVVQPNRFFCLGDNSPRSSDGRLWSEVDPWYEAETGVPTGYVPREMMIGRAFFVYFPAPQPIKDGGMNVVPYFGKMRFIH